MKKTKIFSVVLALFLILTLNVGAVKAADTANIYLDAVQAKSGIVTVSCKAENIGEISNGKLRIHYAADKLQLVKTELGAGMKSAGFMAEINDPVQGNKQAGEIVVAFASSTKKAVEGDLVTMTFSADDKIDFKDAGLTLKAEEWNGASGSDVKVIIKELTYRSEISEKPGDDPKPTVKKISLDDTQISAIKDQTYNKKAVRPGVTIQYQGKVLVEAKDYAITYKNNKKVGKATATIKGIGDYEGTKTVNFYIAPRPARIKKAVSTSRKKVKLTWTRRTSADGYQIKIARDKKFTKKVKTVTIKKNSKLSKKIKVKGKGKAKYYVKIRSYKVIDGQKHFGKYSVKKAVRVK